MTANDSKRPSKKKPNKADVTSNSRKSRVPIDWVAMGAESEKLVLKLYVTGSTPQSTRALINLKRIFEEHLDGNYDLQVIDVYQKPELAREQQIIAAPTLVKLLPLPIRRLIGDMSDEGKVLVGLSILPEDEAFLELQANRKKKD